MKAQTKLRGAADATSKIHELALRTDQFRISKAYKPEENSMGEAEMAACFLKLRELVPTIPQNKKVSKVQLLQHVIDYILDLELTLENHPAMRALTPPTMVLERRPLAESLYLNAKQMNSGSEGDNISSCSDSPVSC